MTDLEKTIKATIALALISVVLVSLTQWTFATDPPRRRDECTVNWGLLRAYPNTWYPYVWNWNADNGWPVEPDEYSYFDWTTDGEAFLRCEDHGAFDGIYLATNFDQTADQGLIEVDFSTVVNMWLEASRTTIDGNQYPFNLASWTGAKFDIIAVEKGANPRTLMMEMYIWRTGANTVWINEYARKTSVGSTVWNYLVALDWWHNDYCIEWDANSQHYFAVNVFGLLKRGISQVNSMLPVDGEPPLAPDPPFNVNDFKLARVDFCLEAGNNGDFGWTPKVWATLTSLRTRYNSADVNGDGRVDMRDISFVTSKFGSKLGDGKYDFRADVNTDGQVDMRDVAYETSHFGEKY